MLRGLSLPPFAAQQLVQFSAITASLFFGRSTIGAIQCNYCLAGFFAAQQFVQFSAITASLVFLPFSNSCNSVQLLPRCFFAAQQLVQFSAITASLFFCRSSIRAIQCNVATIIEPT
ncbi:MAG: hypothetical protein IJ160_05580 [Muribaculaceae bacterium]|nr:hypothetical protein [Muribaculaceae bacterium]